MIDSRLPKVLLAVVILAVPIQAQEIHSELCLHGCPSGSPAGNDLIVRKLYILSSNDRTKLADWAAYRVTSETFGWEVSRDNRTYLADPLLDPSETLEPSDYVGSPAALKIDRGHLVPLASFSETNHWETLNYMSNITPQGQGLNRGPWYDLETAVSRRLTNLGPVYVSTGTLYETPRPYLPRSDESHMIPSGYWKVVAVEPSEGDIAVSAFVFPHDTRLEARFCNDRYWTTVREIERATGLDFFHALDKPHQDEIELDRSRNLLAALGC